MSSLDDAMKWAEEVTGQKLELVASQRIVLTPETHQQTADRLFEQKLITAECHVTPCKPCDGRVESARFGYKCVCSCHKKKTCEIPNCISTRFKNFSCTTAQGHWCVCLCSRHERDARDGMLYYTLREMGIHHIVFPDERQPPRM